MPAGVVVWVLAGRLPDLGAPARAQDVSDGRERAELVFRLEGVVQEQPFWPTA